MKDFGVTFDPELSFNFHYNEKMNKSSRKGRFWTIGAHLWFNSKL